MSETTCAAELQSLVGALGGVLGGLVPAGVPLSEVAALWDGFDAVARLGDAGRTLLGARVEEAEGWKRAGHRSAAEHLAHRGGVSTGAARSLLATSKRLGKCPLVESALRQGRLSAQQADVISDAAEADPSAEQRLVDLAEQTSVAELRVECARAKAAADPDPEKRRRRIHRQRRLRQGTNAEGAWWLSGQGTTDAGAGFNTVLEPIIDELFDQARDKGERVSRETLAFDALMELARRLWNSEERDLDEADADEADADEYTGDDPDRGEPGADEPGIDEADADESADRAAADENTGDDPDVEASGSSKTCSEETGVDEDRRDLEPGELNKLVPAGSNDASGGPASCKGTVDESPIRRAYVADRPADPSRNVRGRGTTAAGRRGKRRRRRSRDNPRYLGLLRVDLTALVRGRAEGGETCEIAGFGPVPVAAAREVLGDAVLRLVLTRGEDVVNTTYLGRGPNTAQRIALLWSSPTCVVQGCVARRVQHDHRRPWAKKQETRLDNIDDYCEHHHDLKTNHGWALVEGTGKRAMVPPSDPRHPGRKTTPKAQTVAA